MPRGCPAPPSASADHDLEVLEAALGAVVLVHVLRDALGLLLGGDVVGRCQGTIRFPEVSSEKPPSEWELKALCDGEDQSAMRMMNPCGSVETTPIRELLPVEESIKEVMLTTTPHKVLELLSQLMKEMLEKANAPVDFEIPEPEPEQKESEVPAHIQEAVRQQMEQMRVDNLPSKLTEAIAAMQANTGEPRVGLTVSRITDAEAKQIAEALQGNDVVTHLDLSHNEVSDLGVQAIVTCLAMGGAKSLQELRFTSNKYSSMGRTMLSGLGTMRKNLKVVLDP